ncbi:hypothetical protein AVEN_178101-1 [Araneus ventricosus]|uniref:Uncharacterized protein n=1 Tax=Araneus ventricosus TaxID=182803 RepID=A0A4Y2T637_ARAVE|nr:hypothetical protein AVEN_223087-1 [Araneus ventricosus]GBN96097.1 hypothetical protein AVEN_178101-1 [Araneus ventricosus]
MILSLWRPLESLTLPLHYTSHLATRRQVEELYFFMQDAKVLRAHCWSTYLCECLRQFHDRNTLDGVSHLASTEHEPSWLGLDFFFRSWMQLGLGCSSLATQQF